MWTTPKTSWTKADLFCLVPDYERIRGNLLELKAMAARLYPQFLLCDMGRYGIEELPYVEFFNAIEDNLQRMYESTFCRPGYTTKRLAENGPVWSWMDLNRIEETQQQLYYDLTAAAEARPTLALLLGQGGGGIGAI